MRLITRQRQNRRKAPRIAISEQEIAADLHYPAARRPARGPAVARVRGGSR